MNKPDEAMMDRLIARAIEDMKAEKQETIGKTLVKANQLGLRVVNGGKKPTSEDVAKAMIKRNFWDG